MTTPSFDIVWCWHWLAFLCCNSCWKFWPSQILVAYVSPEAKVDFSCSAGTNRKQETFRKVWRNSGRSKSDQGRHYLANAISCPWPAHELCKYIYIYVFCTAISSEAFGNEPTFISLFSFRAFDYQHEFLTFPHWVIKPVGPCWRIRVPSENFSKNLAKASGSGCSVTALFCKFPHVATTSATLTVSRHARRKTFSKQLDRLQVASVGGGESTSPNLRIYIWFGCICLKCVLLDTMQPPMK